MSIEHYSMTQLLSESQAVMAKIMLVTGKESIAAGKSADTQLAIVNQGQQSALDVANQASKLFTLSAVVGGLASVTAGLGKMSGPFIGGSSKADRITFILETTVQGVASVAVPATKGGLEIVESNAQKDLGDKQKTQTELESAGRMVEGQNQLVISAEGDSAEQTQEMARQLSQIISNQKQASTSR
jgi:hypothetical protein